MIDTAKTIFVYDADTSALKAKLKDLQGEEKRTAEASLKAANERNASIEKWTKGIGTAAVALGAAAVAGKLAWEGMEISARKAQLATNVTTESVERLRKGFGGLRTEMQALESANALSNSKMKLTGDQMEMVGKAMRQLVREGHDWEEVNKKVTDALIKLNVSGLDDFGILIEDAKTEGEKFNAFLDAMAEKAGKVGDATKNNAEQMAAMKNSFSDAMDEIKIGLGKVAVAFMPVVDQLAEVAGILGKIANELGGDGVIGKIGSALGWINPIGQGKKVIGAAADYFGNRTSLSNAGLQERVQIPDALRLGPNQSDLGENNPFIPKELNLADVLGSGMSSVNMLAYLASEKGSAYLGGLAKNMKDGTEAAKKAKEEYDRIWNEAYGELIAGGAKVGGGSPADMSLYRYDEGLDINYAQPSLDSSLFDKYAPGGAHDAQAYNQYQAGKNASKLEGIFGPLSDFDAYKSAFDTLNGAIGSAFSAWIDGSASAGAAFKKFIGEALKGVAVQMAMESVKHAAYAIGNLAFGNFAGAATHGKAAAAFAAGAVLVGSAAKGLHGGGGSSAGASAPGGGVPAYGGGSQQQGGSQTVVVAYGQDYRNDSARQRQLRAAQVLDDAKQSGAMNGAVSYA